MTCMSTLLVVLEETGAGHDGLPVLALHRDPAPIAKVLEKGLSGHLLRVYRWGQNYLERREGIQPEPAYLLLSNNEGGFARFGFHLNGVAKRNVGYVDLQKSMSGSGKFGALDQIFPHELGHVILTQFAGPGRPGKSNQIHAIGVRTDPETALSEGFAEHFQVLAVDDQNAEADTALLGRDTDQLHLAEDRISEYARELLDGPSSPPGLQARFPWWFSGTEQVLRYCAVKRNGYACEPETVSKLLDKGALYEAYLVANIVPGRPVDAVKAPGVLASTEGVVASLFYRWVTTREITDVYRDDSFYDMFGTTGGEVAPLENAYLKLLHAMYACRAQDVLALTEGYKAEFPEEAAVADAVVSEVTDGKGFETGPALWLANVEFQVGTSVFDQFRAMPRAHTMDLNSSSLVDLLTIPGVDRELAGRILEGAPYSSVDDLCRVPGISDALRDRFARMASAMSTVQSTTEEVEVEFLKNVGTILKSYTGKG